MIKISFDIEAGDKVTRLRGLRAMAALAAVVAIGVLPVFLMVVAAIDRQWVAVALLTLPAAAGAAVFSQLRITKWSVTKPVRKK